MENLLKSYKAILICNNTVKEYKLCIDYEQIISTHTQIKLNI